MMAPVFAILRKDIKSLLTSPMFYFLTGLCASLWGLFFAFEVFAFVQRSYQLSTQVKDSGLNIHQNLISSYVVIVHYVLVFVIASLSIRFFAEEKKMRTFPILLTSPMTSWQIVLSKWLVGAFYIFFLLLVSAIYPLSLLFFVKIPLGLFFLSYIGVFIVLCVYMSVAMLASSLTESLIVCVVLTLVTSIFLLLLGVGRGLTDSLFLQQVFHYMSFDYHFLNFRKGIVSLSSIFYFLSWSFFLSLLTERVVEYNRWR